MFSFDTKREPEKCALCGESYCLLSACKDAPLGQRQGGVSRQAGETLYAKAPAVFKTALLF